MSEPGFREIQLSTKQVVFLFIASVVAAVAIFLLGVSVGRGVTGERPETTQAEPAPAVADAGPIPPATTPKPGELQYHNELQGKAEAKAPPPPVPTPEAPPETKPTPTPAPATTPKPTPATKPAAPAAGELFVQVDSFSSMANASRQVSRLKTLGITAAVYTAPTGAARYKVRVGPFPTRSAAEAMRDRLRKEGFKPSII